MKECDFGGFTVEERVSALIAGGVQGGGGSIKICATRAKQRKNTERSSLSRANLDKRTFRNPGEDLFLTVKRGSEKPQKKSETNELPLETLHVKGLGKKKGLETFKLPN